MISNEDYKDIKDGSENGLTVLYRYYVANYGSRVPAGHFMIKFTSWCQRYLKLQSSIATEIIINYLDRKHEYQGFIENWR